MTDPRDLNLLNEVFNQRALILTFFGALGGSVRATVLKTSWKEGLRVVFVGGAVAFGVGILGPVILKPWIGDVPEKMAGAMGTLTATSFLIGLVAVTLVERFISDEGNEPLEPTCRNYLQEEPVPEAPEDQNND